MSTIGLFAGTATAAPSGKVGSASAQSTAAGFGATLLEAVSAAVPGAAAPAGDPQAAPAPTADEIFAALTTGFAGTGTAPVAEDAAATDQNTDDDQTDATAPAPAAETPGASPLPAAAVPPLPAAALPALPAAPVSAAAEDAPADATGAPGATGDAVIAPLAATAPVVTSAAAATVPRASTAAAAPVSGTTGSPSAAEPVPGEAASTGSSAPASKPASAAPVAPSPAASASSTPAATPLAAATVPAAAPAQAAASASPAVAAAPPAVAAAAASTDAAADSAPDAAESPLLPKEAPVAAPVAFTTAATVSTPVTAAAASAPLVAQPVPLATQVAGPIFTLAAAGNGEHVMTVDITPDNLGPITVRAHVGADGVRVELFAPNDLARDALRAILPDIRKDMGGAGLGSNLDLSSQNQPADRGDSEGQQRRQQQGESLVTLEQQAVAARPWLLTDPSTTIDVMA